MSLAQELGRQSQLIIVDEQELATACAALLPAYEWVGKTQLVWGALRDRSCVVVGRASAVCHLELDVLAKKLAAAGATKIQTVAPEPNRPSGWSLDNALDAKWDGKRIFDWLKANAVLFNPVKPKRRSLTEIWAESKLKAEAAKADDPKVSIWQRWKLQHSQNGIPHANLNNAMAILEQDEALTDLVWYDDFLNRVMTDDPPREWGDADDIHLALHVQRDIGITRLGRDIISQAVIGMAQRNRKNCVRDWMETLTHDGEPRLDAFFEDCFSSPANEYTVAASRNFWLSMIARIYSPGCKVDNMIVLEGSQGVGKSTALQIIGGEWFAEQHESATNPKAFAEILQGKLLIEISEMDSFNRAEVSRVKQTVSCPSDRFRPSYGRHSKDHPRQCVFVGTTNRDDWNRDETGARRFWPIRCKSINLEAIRANRDQLFAEAIARFKAGEPHWLMPIEQTKEEQLSRHEGDAWFEQIAQIVKGEDKLTSSQVAEKLGIPLEKRDRFTEMRIGKCLRLLGWFRRQRRLNGYPAWVYLKPNGDGSDGGYGSDTESST